MMKSEEMSAFPVGKTNNLYAEYFVGQSYLNMLSMEQVVVGNVSFELIVLPKTAHLHTCRAAHRWTLRFQMKFNMVKERMIEKWNIQS